MTSKAVACRLSLSVLALTLLAVPASADFRLSRTLPLASGGELVMNVAGAITVTAGSGEQVELLITSRSSDIEDRYDFAFDAQPGRVEVTTERKGGWSGRWFDWNRHGLRFEVRVPRRTALDLRSSGGPIQTAGLVGPARLRSSGGGIEVSDHAGDVDAHTSGGGAAAHQVQGNVKLESSGGGITATGVSGDVYADTSGGGVKVDTVGGDVWAASSGGGVHVRGVHGRVEAKSSGGPVSAVFAAGSEAGGSLSSSGGGVSVAVDPRAALTIDASSSGGRVSYDVPIRAEGRASKSSVRGDLNGGGEVLRLRSSGGGVRIDSLDGR